jgi:hypothetical protein
MEKQPLQTHFYFRDSGMSSDANGVIHTSPRARSAVAKRRRVDALANAPKLNFFEGQRPSHNSFQNPQLTGL